MATGVTHRTVEANGIRLHLAEQGEGPLVMLCHGFPEFVVLVAPSARRSLGRRLSRRRSRHARLRPSDRPEAIEQYTLLHLVGDMVGLLDALGAEQAVIAGHDWGAPVAWHAALLRPDRFRGVIGLSVPYRPRTSVRADDQSCRRRDDALFYQLYFQKPGVAEAELERDPRETILKLLFSGSGDVPRRSAGSADASHQTAAQGDVGMVPRDGGFLSRMVKPAVMPPWLGEADIDFYAGEFARTGFRGGLNWYRNIDRNWELLAPFARAKVTVPALYVAGDRDLVVAFRGMDKMIANLTDYVPHLRADDHAAGMRALDSAGARGGGQRRDDRLPPAIVSGGLR